MNRAIVPISKKSLRELAKKKGVKKITSMSSAEFRELQGKQGISKTKPTMISPEFSFVYKIEDIKGGYKITLFGKHLSKNRYDSLSFSSKLRYKNAIKNAAKEYWLLNRSFFKKLSTLKKASVRYEFYEPYKRDPDAEQETIKRFQDTFTLLKLIVDDDIDYLVPCGIGACKQIKSKEYKAVAYLIAI